MTVGHMCNVSILLATHRLDKTLDAAIQSILEQTFNAFELIIIANGHSRDEIKDHVEQKFSDDRIKVFSSRLIGLADNLNFGLSLCKSDLVARMDDDDVCVEKRLERQYEYFMNKRVDVLNSKIIVKAERPHQVYERAYPQTDFAIRLFLPIYNCLAHPAVMYRKSVIEEIGGYRNLYRMEDYDLWIRLRQKHHVRFAAIADPLLIYRKWEQPKKMKVKTLETMARTQLRFAKENMSPLFFLGFLLSRLKIVHLKCF